MDSSPKYVLPNPREMSAICFWFISSLIIKILLCEGCLCPRNLLWAILKHYLAKGSPVLPTANRCLSQGSRFDCGGRGWGTEITKSKTPTFMLLLENLCWVVSPLTRMTENPSRAITPRKGVPWLPGFPLRLILFHGKSYPFHHLHLLNDNPGDNFSPEITVLDFSP